MSQNLRAIRRKIRATTNISQITRAMKMVAAAKLQRAQARVLAGRAYATWLSDLLAEVAAAAGDDIIHPYLASPADDEDRGKDGREVTMPTCCAKPPLFCSSRRHRCRY